VTEVILSPLQNLGMASRWNSFRVAPSGWPGPAHGIAPVFDMDARQLWRAWMEFAARQPRIALQAEDERARRSLHVQRSALFRFPDVVRAEVVALASRRSSLVLDSRSRFGCWDLGVNRHRITRWLHELRITFTSH
jgi:uncharacterized protein (DUF1499 family)